MISNSMNISNMFNFREKPSSYRCHIFLTKACKELKCLENYDSKIEWHSRNLANLIISLLPSLLEKLFQNFSTFLKPPLTHSLNRWSLSSFFTGKIDMRREEFSQLLILSQASCAQRHTSFPFFSGLLGRRIPLPRALFSCPPDFTFLRVFKTSFNQLLNAIFLHHSPASI